MLPPNFERRRLDHARAPPDYIFLIREPWTAFIAYLSHRSDATHGHVQLHSPQCLSKSIG